MAGPSESSDQPRDEESQRFTAQSSVREILDTFEKHGEENIPTGDLAEELDYTKHGISHRLRKELPEYVEEENLGQGNPILWSLRYTRSDFLGALDELEDLTGTDEIAEYVGCNEEVAKEWMFKLKDEGEVVSKPRGQYGLLWVMKS